MGRGRKGKVNFWQDKKEGGRRKGGYKKRVYVSHNSYRIALKFCWQGPPPQYFFVWEPASWLGGLGMGWVSSYWSWALYDVYTNIFSATLELINFECLCWLIWSGYLNVEPEFKFNSDLQGIRFFCLANSIFVVLPFSKPKGFSYVCGHSFTCACTKRVYGEERVWGWGKRDFLLLTVGGGKKHLHWDCHQQFE